MSASDDFHESFSLTRVSGADWSPRPIDILSASAVLLNPPPRRDRFSAVFLALLILCNFLALSLVHSLALIMAQKVAKSEHMFCRLVSCCFFILTDLFSSSTGGDITQIAKCTKGRACLVLKQITSAFEANLR